MNKSKLSQLFLSSLVSTTFLSSVAPVKANATEMDDSKIIEDTGSTVISAFENTSEEFIELAKTILQGENKEVSEAFEEALVYHHNKDFSLAVEAYDNLLMYEVFPDEAIDLVEWLTDLAEKQINWTEESFSPQTEEISSSSEEHQEVDSSEEDSLVIDKQEMTTYNKNTKEESDGIESEIADNEALKEPEIEGNEEINEELSELQTLTSSDVDNTSTSQSDSNEMFDAVLNAQTATEAWNAAQDFKEAYPNDSRLAEAMDSAAQRIFAMGQSSQNRERYPLARQYYDMLINEPAVSASLREAASSLHAETIEAENGSPADSLYEAVLEASTATAAWNAAQEFKAAYPNDSRLAEAMDSAAQRIFAMGQSSQNRERYPLARQYYDMLINEPVVNASLRGAASSLHAETIEAENGSPADSLYEAVLEASTATAAWNAAQDFKEAYPNDSRLAEAMDSAAQRIFAMGLSSQNRERYPLARQYYDMLIKESAVSNNLRNQASTKYAETIEAENKHHADDLYDAVINASTATAAWNAAQDFKAAFPNDSRLPAAIDSAAQRILSMGTSNHRRGNFNTANTYYSQLLNEQNLSSSLRREVNELIQLSRQGIRLRTVNEYYNDSVNGATATDAWNIAVEGLKYNPGNARLVDALNMAAQRQFSMGQSQHRNGNYSSALTYYNRVFNHSSVRSDIRQVVGIFRTQAQQSRPLMTSVDYSNQSVRANTASAAWDIAIEGLIAYPHNSDIIDALNQAANRNLSLGRSQFRQGNFSSARTYFNRVANQPAVSEPIRTLAGVFLQQLTPNYNHTVYIDAGHGGRDPGASFGGVRESDLNLSTALLLRTELQKLGYNVVMSRETDVFIEMSDRPFEANSISADIFVSIHYNSMGGAGTARGIESFIYHRVASGFGQETNRNNFRTEDPRIDESLRLADAMHANLISDTNMRDRGVKGNNFNVLRNSHIPAMLTELAFLDNPADRSIAVTREFQLSAARAMARGIDAYFNN